MDERDCIGWWDAYTFFSSAQDEEKFEFAESLRDFIGLGEQLAAAAEDVGLDASALIRFLHRTQDVYYNVAQHLPQDEQDAARFPVADEPLRVWMDRLRFRLRNKNTATLPVVPISPPIPSSLPTSSSLPASSSPSVASVPSVVLKSRHDEVLVNGVVKKALTEQRYKVIQALLAVWPGSLNKDELPAKSGCGDARGVLTRMIVNDPDWRAVIVMAKEKGGGYRLV